MNSPGVEFLKISFFVFLSLIGNIIISKMATNKNKMKTILFITFHLGWICKLTAK